MFRKLLVVFTTLLVFLLASACSEPNSNKATKKTEEKKDFQAATTLTGMIKEGPGKYSGDQYDEKKLKTELKQLPDNMSTRKAYNHLIQLLAEDYQPYWNKLNRYDISFDKESETPGGIKGSKGQPVDELNVAILLDASGSMAGQVSGGVKMDLAKQAVQEFASKLPDNAKVSLRVYGHKGSNSDQDKKVSCASNEVVYPLSPYDQNDFEKSLDQFKPTGWTPVAEAIKESKSDLEPNTAENTQNLIYVVSDGKETCGGDPAKEAKKLHKSGIQAVVNIIGFDVDDAGQQQLKKAAEVGGGSYTTVNSQRDLEDYFDQQYYELSLKWADWKNENVSNVIDQSYELEEKLLSIVYDQVVPMRKKEISRLYDASSYLYREGKVKSDAELRSLIGDRNIKLKDGFKDKHDEVFSQIQKAWKEKVEQIEDINDKKQREIDQKRDNQ